MFTSKELLPDSHYLRLLKASEILRAERDTKLLTRIIRNGGFSGYIEKLKSQSNSEKKATKFRTYQGIG